MLLRSFRRQFVLALAVVIALPVLLPATAHAGASTVPDFPARDGCTPAEADDCASGTSGVDTIQYRFFGRADRWLTNPGVHVYAPNLVAIDPATITMRHSTTDAVITPNCGAPIAEPGDRYRIFCQPTPGITYNSGEGILVAFPSTAAPTYSGTAIVRMMISDANFGGIHDEPTPWNVLLTSDLSVALTRSGSTEVPTDMTYSATVANAGPDATTATRVTFDLPSQAGIVSSAVDGAAVTCTPVASSDATRQPVECAAGAIASGDSRLVTMVVRYAVGERGLSAVPATLNTTVSAALGVGNDAADPNAANDAASLAVTLLAPPPADTCITGSAADGLSGCPFGSPIYGGTGDDIFTGGAGIDIFFGNAGDDIFRAAGGDDYFSGGPGSDAAHSGSGNDKLVGGRGPDRLIGAEGADLMFGGGGHDRLFGSADVDLVIGGSGNDLVRGGRGADRVFCGGGIDIATGDEGNDSLGCRDGAGGDTVSGGPGTDLCVGDPGDRFLGCERVIRP